MKTFVYYQASHNTKRVGWISGTLEDRAKSGATRALVKYLDGSDSTLALCSKLTPLTDFEKALWKIEDQE